MGLSRIILQLVLFDFPQLLVLKYVQNKDVFMRYHKAHLTRRLILDSSADNEKEENMVEWLRVCYACLLALLPAFDIKSLVIFSSLRYDYRRVEYFCCCQNL